MSPETVASTHYPTLLSLLHSPLRAVIEGQLWKLVVALHQIVPFFSSFWLQDSIDLILHQLFPLIVFTVLYFPLLDELTGVPAAGPAKHPVFLTIGAATGVGSAVRPPEHKCSYKKSA